MAKIITKNRKARLQYDITDTIEAGIVLLGTEIKSLREGKGSIDESYARDKEGELVLVNSHIPRYKPANLANHKPERIRKLLLKKKEMNKLIGAITRQGQTIIPLDIHLNKKGLAKVSLGLATGKKKKDKRQTIKEKEWKREKKRVLDI
ncbi:MAG: SsrA-binding protein [Rickettsiales bacterium]|nr:SsrA-binding protein [Rickettsiales bacterium]